MTVKKMIVWILFCLHWLFLISKVEEIPDFSRNEENILKFWDEIDAFKQQLEKTKDLPPFTFYDGPPFATGLPHYGNLLAGTIKVIIIS